MKKSNKWRYRPQRLSKRERDDLSRMNFQLYGVKQMPAKSKTNSAVANTEPVFKYLDANGIEQSVDLSKVKNLGDTAYAESQTLFPNATQCYIGKEGIQYDSEGRQNVINQNLVILEARRMTKGDYGPWFLLRCAHPKLGEISIPAPGQVARDAIQAMSGISLEDGSTIGASEFPVWARFEFVKDAGAYNGYFVIMPALEQLTSDE